MFVPPSYQAVYMLSVTATAAYFADLCRFFHAEGNAEVEKGKTAVILQSKCYTMQSGTIDVGCRCPCVKTVLIHKNAAVTFSFNPANHNAKQI